MHQLRNSHHRSLSGFAENCTLAGIFSPSAPIRFAGFESERGRRMRVGVCIFFVNTRQHNVTQNPTSSPAGSPSRFGLCNKWRKAREQNSLAFFFCSSKAFILFPSLNSVLMNTGFSRGHDGRSSVAAAPAAFADKNSSVISSLRNERNHAQAHRRRKRVSCERQKYNSLHLAPEKLTASAPPVVSRRRNLSVGR